MAIVNIVTAGYFPNERERERERENFISQLVGNCTFIKISDFMKEFKRYQNRSEYNVYLHP
jgi:hypothetical protein